MRVKQNESGGVSESNRVRESDSETDRVRRCE